MESLITYDRNKTKYLHLNEYGINTSNIKKFNSGGNGDGDGDGNGNVDAKANDDPLNAVHDNKNNIGLKSSSTEINKITNFVVTRTREGDKAIFINGPNSYILKVQLDISGKSGDKAYIINDVTNSNGDGDGDGDGEGEGENKDPPFGLLRPPKYVLKIFTRSDKKKNTEKNKNEIKYQQDFCKIFENYKPCPQIYYHGILTNLYPFLEKNKKIPPDFPTEGVLYMIMELYNGITLDEHISNICQNNKVKEGYENVDMYDIIKQLFYLISKMQIESKLIHCDLHGKNIFIIQVDDNVKYNFKHIGLNDANYETNGYVVKLLDFGEGAGESTSRSRSKSKITEQKTNLVPCKKSRLSTQSLEDLKFICQKKNAQKEKLSGMFTLAKGETIGQKGNVDINFMTNIIKILQLAIQNLNIKEINTQKILEESAASDYNNNFKTRLKNIYNIIFIENFTNIENQIDVEEKIKSKNNILKKLQEKYAEIAINIKTINKEIAALNTQRKKIIK